MGALKTYIYIYPLLETNQSKLLIKNGEEQSIQLLLKEMPHEQITQA